MAGTMKDYLATALSENLLVQERKSEQNKKLMVDPEKINFNEKQIQSLYVSPLYHQVELWSIMKN